MPVLNVEPMVSGYPQEMLDRFKGQKLVICGGGKPVWDDLASINVTGDNPNGFDVMTINDITMHYPGRIRHAYSNDHRWLPKWIQARRELITNKYGPVEFVHSNNTGARFNWPWPGHGSSGLGALYTGLAMGYTKIVLCGIPLDDSGHYFDPPWIRTNFTREVGSTAGNGEIMYWAKAKRRVIAPLPGRIEVYSQSGRTAKLFGRYGGSCG